MTPIESAARTRSVRQPLAFGCALLLGLVGCGGGGGDTPATSASTTTPAPAAAPAPAAPPATGGTPSAVAPDFASLEDCLSNKWILLADQLQRKAARVLPSNVSATITGQGIVTIARDGTYTYAPSLGVRMNTPAGVATGNISGISRGTWSISGTTLTTVETSNSITGSVSGSFGVVPLPPQIGFSSGTSTILACNPAYFDHEFALPSGPFVERLVI